MVCKILESFELHDGDGEMCAFSCVRCTWRLFWTERVRHGEVGRWLPCFQRACRCVLPVKVEYRRHCWKYSVGEADGNSHGAVGPKGLPYGANITFARCRLATNCSDTAHYEPFRSPAPWTVAHHSRCCCDKNAGVVWLAVRTGGKITQLFVDFASRDTAFHANDWRS